MQNSISDKQLAHDYRMACLDNLYRGEFEASLMMLKAYIKTTLDNRADDSCDMENENGK